MKKTLVSFVVCGISMVSFQEISPKDALKSMVEAEKAFAQMAVDKNVKEAFLQNLDTDAVVFEKGLPVNALAKWEKSNFQGGLKWQPTRAGIDNAGELGYTTGNWQSYTQQTQTGTGSFITLWKKMGKTWKVLADIGVTHAASTGNQALQERLSMFKPDAIRNMQVETEKYVFMKDHFFWKNAKTSQNPFESNLSEQVVVFRDNTTPIEGKKAAITYLSKNYNTKWIYTGLKVIASTSGDMACVYGTITGKDAQGKNITGTYLRIWQQEAKNIWRLTIDVESVE